MLHIHKAVNGLPVTKKMITVTGEGKNLLLFSYLLELQLRKQFNLLVEQL